MNDRIVRSLDEDFAKIGWDKGTRELQRLSTQRLDESLYNVQSITADPIDGPVVTVELLNRIADLDFDALSEDDCDALLDGLREKDLPEGDAELEEAAEAVVKAILESRKKIKIKATGGGTFMKAASGYKTVDGKQVKQKSTDLKTAARKRERYNKRTAAKRKLYAKTKGKRLAAKRERMGLSADDMSDGLVLELNHILGESTGGEYADTVSRIARIMRLLEHGLGSEVGNVLESAFDKMETSLLAESEDPARAFGPVLKVIARCLEQIDEMGND
jgi:hypothetical protein